MSKYVRFNNKDTVISIHKKCIDSLSKISVNNLDEDYISTDEVDISDLCDISKIKKNDVIIGLWDRAKQAREDKVLIKLMAKYLNKEIVDSEETPSALAKKGLESLKSLNRTLAIYGIDFDLWIEKYKQEGEELAKEIQAKILAEAEKDALEMANLEKSKAHFSGACFSLPAIAGKMGASIYYTVQIPFGQVPQLFKFNEELVPVEFRAQRVINEKRAQAIADYICNRQFDYTLPALTASVSESMKFDPVTGFENVGAVMIPIGATLQLNDGQHRQRGIELALEQNPLLKDQSISVVLFYDQGLQRSQQMFADINDQMVKPPKALSILFDQKNVLNKLVVESIESAGLKHCVEFEKANVGAKSNKIWSISALKKSAEILTGLNDKSALALDKDNLFLYKKLFTNWLKSLVQNVGGLKDEVESGTAATLTETRVNKVNTHSVFLHSVALASKSICESFHEYIDEPLENNVDAELKDFSFVELEMLKNLTVNKSSDLWRERIVNTDGTMNPTANGIKLGAYVILEKLQLDIPKAIEEVNYLVFSNWEK